MVTALTIAGIDPGGGAGIAADLKTFEAHGVWGTCAVADIAGHPLPGALVARQVRSFEADAVKVGPLASVDVAEAVAPLLGGRPVVTRPAIFALLSRTTVIVTGSDADRDGMAAEAEQLATLGAVVMVTGGHLGGDDCPDVVWGGSPVWLEGERLPGPTYGAGDVLASAIAAELARGMAPVDACVAAKRFVTRAVAAATPAGVNPGWARDATRSA